ncbi:putative Calcium/calmodulin-dependent protein kinase kinase [Trypanosoma cruzi]|uniref:Protein kinase domain-containing protein n=1 Tax=Trypanosoma cruzi TaxID=5693 RepID=A0A7J6YCZ8_TRYCR|nr:hypothetical protein ECC02_002873 [Trypanosoma cruzi]KAF8302820.1 putative Calcium/calmodulin-dependent protein kinase kinase [Trypanosoma cruzi]
MTSHAHRVYNRRVVHAEEEKVREPPTLTAEALLSWYTKAVRDLQRAATRHTRGTAERPPHPFSLSGLNKWNHCTDGEAECLFSGMSHVELTGFCCRVHCLLSTIAGNICGPSLAFSMQTDKGEAPDSAHSAPWSGMTLHRKDSENMILPRQRTRITTTRERSLSKLDNMMECEDDADFGPPARHNRSFSSLSLDRRIMTTRHASKTHWINGAKILNDYMVLKSIGKGASGKVKLAYSLSRNETVAIKIIPRPKKKAHFGAGRNASAKNAEALRREIEVMKKLRHKNIVPLYEVIDDPDAEKLYLVMRYVDNGPLAVVGADGRCPKMMPDELVLYARQILAGLEYLHECGVVHRDIKPENIIVDRNKHAFLADFGVAAILEEGCEDIFNRFEGTPLFMPPELFFGVSNNDDENDHGDSSPRGNPFAIDVWSLGVAFYTLLMGRVPFLSVKDIEAVLQSPIVIADEVPQAWRLLLKSMLAADPRQRPKISDVRIQVEKMSCGKVMRQEEAVSPRLAPCDDDSALLRAENSNSNACISSPHIVPVVQPPWLVLPRLLNRGNRTNTPESTSTVVDTLGFESNTNSALSPMAMDGITRRIKECMSLNSVIPKVNTATEGSVDLLDSPTAGKATLFMEATQRPLRR